MEDYEAILAQALELRKRGATLQQVALALPIRLGDLMSLDKPKPQGDRSPDADHRD